MKYAYEVQSDGAKTVHVFPDEMTRAQWIAARPSPRGVLSGNSREVKAALYRTTAISRVCGLNLLDTNGEIRADRVHEGGSCGEK